LAPSSRASLDQRGAFGRRDVDDEERRVGQLGQRDGAVDRLLLGQRRVAGA
jgi:hypothetical protein